VIPMENNSTAFTMFFFSVGFKIYNYDLYRTKKQ
jgi:hypothetical protein